MRWMAMVMKSNKSEIIRIFSLTVINYKICIMHLYIYMMEWRGLALAWLIYISLCEEGTCGCTVDMANSFPFTCFDIIHRIYTYNRKIDMLLIVNRLIGSTIVYIDIQWVQMCACITYPTQSNIYSNFFILFFSFMPPKFCKWMITNMSELI